MFGLNDVKRAHALVLGDSSVSFFGRSGSTYDAQEMFTDRGWANLVYEARPGEGIQDWEPLLRAYVAVHRE